MFSLFLALLVANKITLYQSTKGCINSELHFILATVFIGEELESWDLAASSDRKPEGKSVTSGPVGSHVCCHTHFFRLAGNKNLNSSSKQCIDNWVNVKYDYLIALNTEVQMYKNL